MDRKNETVRSVVLGTVRRQPLLCTALVLAVAGAVAASLLPPLVLPRQYMHNKENAVTMRLSAH